MQFRDGSQRPSIADRSSGYSLRWLEDRAVLPSMSTREIYIWKNARACRGWLALNGADFEKVGIGSMSANVDLEPSRIRHSAA